MASETVDEDTTLDDIDNEHSLLYSRDRQVLEIISKLKFLSKIRLGEKLNVKEMFVRDNDSLTQRVLRTIRNTTAYLGGAEPVESKEATLKFVQQIINGAISMIAAFNKQHNDINQRYIKMLTENIEKSKEGIRNLIATYQGDRKFISEAEATMQTLQAKIQSLEQKGYVQGLTASSFMPDLDELSTTH